MKSKKNWNPIKLNLLAAIVLTTFAFAAAANAQPSFVSSFTLPYEVHWGTNMLPAGEYEIVINSLGAPALIRSASGKTQMYTATPVLVDCDKDTAALFINTRGNERRVHSLSLPDSGVSLIFTPPTEPENETAAKTDRQEVLPVISARK